MTVQRMKSDQVRQNWRDVLDHVRHGDTVLVEHYNRPVARVIPDDDTLVVLRVPDAVQAERLRRLVREHGALGIPFPNNSGNGWQVVDDHDDFVNPHAIPSVPVEIVHTEEPQVTTYTAAIGLISSVVAGAHCDVSVAENDLVGARIDDDGVEVPEYAMGNKVVLDPVELNVRTDDEDVAGKVYDAADAELTAQGWHRTGDWDDAAGDAAYAPVERT